MAAANVANAANVRSTRALVAALAVAVAAAACGTATNAGFGGPGGADGGHEHDATTGRTPDGGAGQRDVGAPRAADGATGKPGPDGATGTKKDAGSGANNNKKDGGAGTKKDSGAPPAEDGGTAPGKDGGKDGASPPPKDSGMVMPGTDSSAPPVDAGYDAAPVITGCDFCETAGGTCTAGVCALTENPGMLSTATQTQLQGGGSADPGLKWLYPYDQTVFPAGILSPLLQFGGTPPDAVLVNITFPELVYNGFFGPSTAPLGGGQAAISAAAWTALTALAAPSDAVTVSVTKISGGQVSGPITETWHIAPGALRGVIYHETYGSQIIGGAGVGIMEIQPGATAPTVVKSGCGNVCHTASANGSTLVANAGNLFSYTSASASYALGSSVTTIHAASSNIFTYGGLYPDGTFAMSATNYRTWLGQKSKLYDTATGANIAAAGWDGVISKAGTSAFSLDGTMIAFNHEDTGGGHTLATMSFDVGSYTFSNLVDIATDPSRTLAWPAWTPDDTTIVYHAGSSPDFETDNVNDAGVPTTGDIYAVDVASQTTVRLDALDGYSPGGGSYLPANDPGLSFAPTILPEAVGGYFWVVFTSHRSWGNTLPSLDNSDVNGKLWVAAIDIGDAAGQDSSHPAFFLQGQELTSDNLRGFWVLDPCQGLGTACTGGDQCCAGYCEPVSGVYQCVSAPANGCSNLMEKCNSAADCCTARNVCINHICSVGTPG